MDFDFCQQMTLFNPFTQKGKWSFNAQLVSYEMHSSDITFTRGRIEYLLRHWPYKVIKKITIFNCQNQQKVQLMKKARESKRCWERHQDIKEPYSVWFLGSGCKIFTEWVGHVSKFKFNDFLGLQQMMFSSYWPVFKYDRT